MKYSVQVSLFFFSLVCAGCQVTTDASSSNSTGEFPAICEIETNNNVVVTCSDFQSDEPVNSAACTASVQQEYAAEGATGGVYLGFSASGGTTSCALTYPNLTLIGSCTLGNIQIIRYYSPLWVTTTAQTQCEAQLGVWSPAL
jgi:hypothetical protein